MSNLSDRQEKVLAIVIRDYIETAQPVSSTHISKRLVDLFGLKASSATVRNELVALTDLGYLRQPYTSAGRVPTEDGYRNFVSQLIGNTQLPMTTQRSISRQFTEAGDVVDSWMRLAASVLSQQSQAASLVTAPRSEKHQKKDIYKHLELINTYSRQVLLVLVVDSGEVRQLRFASEEPVTQEQLTKASRRLNEICLGLDATQIKTRMSQFNSFERDVIQHVISTMSMKDRPATGEVYRDGLSYVLAEPDSGSMESAQNALRLLEERSLLDDLLSHTVLANESLDLQVLIDGEDTWEVLRDWTLILARYGEPGLAIGTLGILGPMRMPYRRSISTVMFVADLLSGMVTEMHTNSV